jgi:hypothetical protein
VFVVHLPELAFGQWNHENLLGLHALSGGRTPRRGESSDAVSTGRPGVRC